MPTDTPPLVHVHLDFETFCALDLKKVGVSNYVSHPSFAVLAVACKIDGGPTRSTAYPPGRIGGVSDFLNLCLQAANPPSDAMVVIHAWNVAFEYEVIRRVLVPGTCDEIRMARHWSCTMQRALAYGLPASLERAADALGSARKKDMTGKRLMLSMSKPVAKTGKTLWDGATADETDTLFVALSQYCAADVDAEASIAAMVPELSAEEKTLSGIDRAMNRAGVPFDMKMVKALKACAEKETAAEAHAVTILSKGVVTNPATQSVRLRDWFNQMLAVNGINYRMTGVGREDVEEALAIPEIAKLAVLGEVLKSRQRAAKSSVAKLQRIEEAVDNGGFATWQFQFMGAGRTGRWAGRGVQVQNLPRVGKGFIPEKTMLAALAGQAVDLDSISQCLRACIVAPSPHLKLFSYDFSQIEARVIAWLAGQQDILDLFRQNLDVYTYAAAQVSSLDRQLGKVMTLALGFGMGAEKFRDTAKTYGVTLTLEEAERFKQAWRASNRQIVSYWYECDEAARSCINARGAVREVRGGVRFQATRRTLQVRLPSERVLYYHAPRIEDGGGIVYMGVDVAKRWVETRTYGGKLVENIVQATARDVMAAAMVRVAGTLGVVPRMTVHDELTYEMEAPVTATEADALAALIGQVPAWAAGLPLAGEHRVGHRYGK